MTWLIKPRVWFFLTALACSGGRRGRAYARQQSAVGGQLIKAPLAHRERGLLDTLFPDPLYPGVAEEVSALRLVLGDEWDMLDT